MKAAWWIYFCSIRLKFVARSGGGMWMQRGIYRFKIYAGVFWEWGMMRAFSGNGMMWAFSGNGMMRGVLWEWE